MLLTNFIFQAVKSISKGEALTVRYTPFLQVDKNYLCFVISFFLNGNKISQLKTIEGCHLRAGLVWLAGWGRSASPRALVPGWWIGLWIEGTFREIERYFEPLMEYLRAWDAWGIFVSKRIYRKPGQELIYLTKHLENMFVQGLIFGMKPLQVSGWHRAWHLHQLSLVP